MLPTGEFNGNNSESNKVRYYVRLIELHNKYHEGKPWIEVIPVGMHNRLADFYDRRLSTLIILELESDPIGKRKDLEKKLDAAGAEIIVGTQLDPNMDAYAVNLRGRDISDVIEALGVRLIDKKHAANRKIRRTMPVISDYDENTGF